MSCCINTYNLCFVSNCSTVSFGNALDSKRIKLVFSFADNTHSYFTDNIINTPYIIDVSALNENASYTIWALNEDGSRYAFNIDGINYYCLKLKTYIENEIL